MPYVPLQQQRQGWSGAKDTATSGSQSVSKGYTPLASQRQTFLTTAPPKKEFKPLPLPKPYEITKTAKVQSDIVNKINSIPKATFADNMKWYTPVGFAAGILQGAINTPGEAFKGATSLGTNIGTGKSKPKQVAGDLAAMAQLPLLFFGGGAAKNTVKTAATKTADGIKVVKNIAKDSGLGAIWGGLAGVQTGKDIEKTDDYVKNFLVNMGVGGLSGTALSATTHVVVPLVKNGASTFGSVFIKNTGKKPVIEKVALSPKVAQTSVIGSGIEKTPAGKEILKTSFIAEKTDTQVQITVNESGKFELPTGQKVDIDTVPAYDPSKYRDLKITPSDRLKGKDVEIEKEFTTYLKHNYDEASTRYSELPDSDGGRILNVDLARELDGSYVKDRSKSAAVHEPASGFIRERYKEMLAQKDPEGRNIVLFTAGGTGAGKSSAIQNVSAMKTLSDNAQIIYDTNMSSFKPAVGKIQEALDAGKEVVITYVHRDPVEALSGGALPRAMRMGRTVPINEHLNTHFGAPATLVKVAEHFAGNDKVQIRVINNARGKGAAEEVGLDFIKNLKYNEGELKGKLASELEKAYAEKRISKTVYEGFKGDTEDVSKGISRQNDAGNDTKPQQENKRPLTTKEVQYIRTIIDSKLQLIRQTATEPTKLISEYTGLYNDITARAKGDKVVLSALRTQLNKEMYGLAGASGDYKSAYATLQTVIKEDPEIGKVVSVLEDKITELDERILTASEPPKNNVAVGEKPQAVQKQSGNVSTTTPTGTGKLKESRAYKRLVEHLEEVDPETYAKVKDDPKLLYNQVNQKFDFENAAKIVEENPQKAYNIAKQYETAPVGQRWESVNIVLSDRALAEKNYVLWKDLERSRSLAQTRAGQGIVAERGRFNDDSPQTFVQRVLDERLKRIGNNAIVDSIDTTMKALGKTANSAKERAVAKIDATVERAYKFTQKERTKINYAQNLLDELTCK